VPAFSSQARDAHDSWCWMDSCHDRAAHSVFVAVTLLGWASSASQASFSSLCILLASSGLLLWASVCIQSVRLQRCNRATALRQRRQVSDVDHGTAVAQQAVVHRQFSQSHPVLAVIQLCSTLACGTGQLLALHVSSSSTSPCFGSVRWSVLCAVVRVACGVTLSLCRSWRLAQVSTLSTTRTHACCTENESTSVKQARH
jgi:hypothetical protein